MNNGIKEILDNFEKYEVRYKLQNETQFVITHREIQILLDYITNLQQIEQDHKQTNATLMSELAKLEEKNDVLKKKLDRRYYKNEYERLKQENERLKVNCNLGYEELKVARDYKSRCEKAIEYLDKVETLAMLDGKIIFSINIFRNILQNGSDKHDSN